MSIYLGNLTIEEFEERTGWTFSKEDKDTFNRLKSDKADIDLDSLHIFDAPFAIHIGTNIYDEIFSILMKYENNVPSKTSLQVSRKEKTKEEIEREERIKKGKEEWERKKQDPNIKWTSNIPFMFEYNDLYIYGFINMFHKGFYNRPEEIKGSMDVLIDPNSKYPFRFRNINITSDYDKDINGEKYFIPHGFYYNLNESFYHKLKNINIEKKEVLKIDLNKAHILALENNKNISIF